MKNTTNLNLRLYDTTDMMDITGPTNSLNHNMEIIDDSINSLQQSNSELKNDERTSAMHRPQNDNIPTPVKNILLNKWSIDADGTKYGAVNTHPNADAHMFESFIIENFLRSI